MHAVRGGSAQRFKVHPPSTLPENEFNSQRRVEMGAQPAFGSRPVGHNAQRRVDPTLAQSEISALARENENEKILARAHEIIGQLWRPSSRTRAPGDVCESSPVKAGGRVPSPA